MIDFSVTLLVLILLVMIVQAVVIIILMALNTKMKEEKQEVLFALTHLRDEMEKRGKAMDEEAERNMTRTKA